VQHIVFNILKSFKIPVMIQGQQIETLLSIGIAVSPDDTENSDEVLKFSDIAMYEAKHDKDANYKFFDRSMLKHDSDG
ncbi:MAG: diguanylate cyclase, partial [Planctomycetaceae bacterium]|nr:diguanylate cyclase [Planctomycetaceae bacterium]